MAAGQNRRKKVNSDATKIWLDEVLQEFNRKDFLYSDPLSVVHRYTEASDQEVVALIAALFAFGNVSSILKTLDQILKPLETHPAKCLEEISSSDVRKIYRKAYYRFYTSDDIVFLFLQIQNLLKAHGSLQKGFLSAWNGIMLQSLFKFRGYFVRDLKPSRGIRFMFADPSLGAAKRWHMFLRWMVRKDEVDLGLWKSIPKSKLIQPLDTHLFKVGRALKLTNRKTPGLQAALEMTGRFLEWDSDDPIKYDFALCRLGVLKQLNPRLHRLTEI
jgi:uncharacterized protein (TIGR02757 family)